MRLAENELGRWLHEHGFGATTVTALQENEIDDFEALRLTTSEDMAEMALERREMYAP